MFSVNAVYVITQSVVGKGASSYGCSALVARAVGGDLAEVEGSHLDKCQSDI